MEAVILINRTFTEVTPESAENGDFSNQGFIEERQAVTFRELVKLMKEHQEPSHSIKGKLEPDENTWFSAYPFTSCYKTRTERTESIHFSNSNTEDKIKYWKLAYKAANKIKVN